MPKTGMRARASDHLIIDGNPARTGIVIGVPHSDGSPPYIVKWLADGHIAMVFPDHYSSIVPQGRERQAAMR